ncbi:MAG: DUF3861 family protein [Rhodanobacteraceae bacterium]|nr:MAG: DUF3861 family protein [Rhodanobacteraceae bacterium]
MVSGGGGSKTSSHRRGISNAIVWDKRVKPHAYRIAVEHLEDKQGDPVAGQSLSFITTNHDESHEIVERIRNMRQFEVVVEGKKQDLLRFGQVLVQGRI